MRRVPARAEVEAVGPDGGFLAPELAAREQARRRALLLAIGGLMLLSTSPVLGHHLALGTHALLALDDHVGILCMVALHALFAPVHAAFHVALAVGVVSATWDRARAWRQMRRILRVLPVQPLEEGSAIAAAARAAGLDPGRVRVVRGLPNPAFTAGWWRPLVYVASGLAERLGRGELTAVLAHERAHVVRRDPLRLSALRFLARLLFWIPAMHRLAADMADEAEVVADDVAAGSAPLVLASAIVRLAGWRDGAPRAVLADAVGFVRDDMLERRVRRLAGEPAHPATHVTRRSLVGAAAMLALAWTSGTVMAHPVVDPAGVTPPSGISIGHCEHHPGPALFHLLCRGMSLDHMPATCRH